MLFALLGFGSTTVDNAPSGADTATTPTTWIGPVVTPGQYGAACNGSTDDTTAMQNAINAAAAAGEPLQLPANSMCVISSMLKMPSGTRIEGAGFGSILKFTWFDASGSASGGAHYLTNADGSGDSNYTLTNFTVAGGGTGLPSGLNAEHPNRLASAVQLHNVTGFTINGIQVRDAPGVSISYLASQNGLIESNHVNHSGRDGITGFATSGLNLAHVTVTNNTISDVGDDAIAVDLPQSGTPPPRPPHRHYDLRQHHYGLAEQPEREATWPRYRPQWRERGERHRQHDHEQLLGWARGVGLHRKVVRWDVRQVAGHQHHGDGQHHHERRTELRRFDRGAE